MKTRHLLLTALALSFSAGTAWAAETREFKGTPRPGITQPVTPCPAGWQLDGKVEYTAEKLPAFNCVPNKGEKVKCGPGTEYFEGGCNFGCRDTLKTK